MYYTTDDFSDPSKMRAGSGGGGSLKDAYVSLKPDSNTGSVHVTLRLIGLPFGFVNYQAFTWENDKKVAKPFPDEGISKKKFNRLGPAPGMVKHFGEDIWKEMGFVGSMRWVQNVIVMEDDVPKVMLLEKGKSVYDHFAKIEKLNRQKNQDKKTEKYVTWLGGPKSHLVDVVAEFNPKMPNNPDITVNVDNEFVEITDEEIEALRKVGEPTEQDLEQIYKFNPAFENTDKYPTWIWFGYPVWRIYKPDRLRTAEGEAETTPVSEVTLSADANDDAVESTKTAGKSGSGGGKAATSKPKEAEPVAEDDNIYEADATDGDDPGW